MYKVIKYFTDLHDGEHPYNVGDIFPREGVKAADARLAELSGSDNKQGVPLIEKIEAKPVAQKPQAKKTAARKPAVKKTGANISAK